MTLDDSVAGRGNTVPKRVRVEAAAGLFSAICTLFATGRHEAARYLASGLSDELRREFNEVMEHQIPLLLEQWNGQVPSEAVLPTIARKRREPEWKQRVETALHEVFEDRDLVATITRGFHYDLLVRLVRKQAENDGIEAAVVLRRLGDVELDTVAADQDPTRYLILKVNSWTPDTDPEVR